MTERQLTDLEQLVLDTLATVEPWPDVFDLADRIGVPGVLDALDKLQQTRLIVAETICGKVYVTTPERYAANHGRPPIADLLDPEAAAHVLAVLTNNAEGRPPDSFTDHLIAAADAAGPHERAILLRSFPAILESLRVWLDNDDGPTQVRNAAARCAIPARVECAACGERLGSIAINDKTMILHSPDGTKTTTATPPADDLAATAGSAMAELSIQHGCNQQTESSPTRTADPSPPVEAESSEAASTKEISWWFNAEPGDTNALADRGSRTVRQ